MSRSTAYGHTNSVSAPPGLVGTIQGHGLLLVLHEPELRVVQASTSAARMLQRPLQTLLLASLQDLGGDADACLRQLLASGPLHQPQPLRCSLGQAPHLQWLEGSVHRVAADALVLELEPLAPAAAGVPEPSRSELLAQLSQAVQRFSEAASVVALAATAAQTVRALLGHDRVVVTEFAPDGSGRVIAEDRPAQQPALPALLGQAANVETPLPAPSERARELYLHKRVRVLVDASAPPSELLPHGPPGSDGGFDLSRSELRSIAPAQALALQQQGVAASVVAALAREGRLWGLIICHHATPRRPGPALRAALELLAEVFMTRVVALENYARAQVRAEVRLLEQRLLEATSIEGDWRAALFRNERALLQPLEAGGALLWHEGEVLACGQVPEGEAREALLRWVQAQPTGPAPLQCTALPPAQAAAGLACGVLAVRLSATQNDGLLWLRPAQPDSGHSLPWTRSDLDLAQAYGHALVDMILQVNAVRLLIAEHQLAQLRTAVAGSQEAAVVADGAQRNFYANAAFLSLSGRRRDEVQHLDALATLFTQPTLARRAIGQVRAEQRPWQGELVLRRPDGGEVPVSVRGEPVPGSEQALLGSIFIFEDLSENKRTDLLRERLEAVLTRTSRAAQPTDGHEVVGAIIANASLAAMDIAEAGAGAEAVPLLAEVEASTERATALLRHIAAIGRPREAG